MLFDKPTNDMYLQLLSTSLFPLKFMDCARNCCFFATQKTEGGEAKAVDLLYMGTAKILSHTKIRANANPYDKRWQEYFSKRSIRINYYAIEPALCC